MVHFWVLGYALSTVDRRGGRTRMIRLLDSVRQRYGYRESYYGEGSFFHLNPLDPFLLRIHEWIEELRIAYEKFMVYLREELQSLESEVDGNGQCPLDLIPSKHSSFFLLCFTSVFFPSLYRDLGFPLFCLVGGCWEEII